MSGIPIAEITNASLDKLHVLKASLTHGTPSVKIKLPLGKYSLPPIVRPGYITKREIKISGTFLAKKNQSMTKIEFEEKKPSLCIEAKKTIADGFEGEWSTSLNMKKKTITLSTSLTGPLGATEYQVDGNAFKATYSGVPVKKNGANQWSFEGTCDIEVTLTIYPNNSDNFAYQPAANTNDIVATNPSDFQNNSFDGKDIAIGVAAVLIVGAAILAPEITIPVMAAGGA